MISWEGSIHGLVLNYYSNNMYFQGIWW